MRGTTEKMMRKLRRLNRLHYLVKNEPYEKRPLNISLIYFQREIKEEKHCAHRAEITNCTTDKKALTNYLQHNIAIWIFQLTWPTPDTEQASLTIWHLFMLRTKERQASLTIWHFFMLRTKERHATQAICTHRTGVTDYLVFFMLRTRHASPAMCTYRTGITDYLASFYAAHERKTCITNYLHFFMLRTKLHSPNTRH